MKVWPTSDTMRKILMHPAVKVPFPASDGLDWPDDAFTTRRLADGDVTTVSPVPADKYVFGASGIVEVPTPSPTPDVHTVAEAVIASPKSASKKSKGE